MCVTTPSSFSSPAGNSVLPLWICSPNCSAASSLERALRAAPQKASSKLVNAMSFSSIARLATKTAALPNCLKTLSICSVIRLRVSCSNCSHRHSSAGVTGVCVCVYILALFPPHAHVLLTLRKPGKVRSRYARRRKHLMLPNHQRDTERNEVTTCQQWPSQGHTEDFKMQFTHKKGFGRWKVCGVTRGGTLLHVGRRH
ncbi:hypothetical protein TRVL_08433 [Trypanosoma vivax]|nr:hypothetical protein TRVL_08433 [Trypanosoma vivax]